MPPCFYAFLSSEFKWALRRCWLAGLTVTGGIGFKNKFDLIADAAEGIEFRFVRSHSMGGVFKAPVITLALSGEGRADLVGVTANCDYRVDAGLEVLVEMIGGMFTGVVTDFAECLDSEWVNFALGLGPGAEDFKEVACDGAEDAFGHMAATGVTGAEDEYFGLGHVLICFGRM